MPKTSVIPSAVSVSLNSYSFFVLFSFFLSLPVFSPFSVSASVPAFPGAEGTGAYALGGRQDDAGNPGRVLIVNSLDDPIDPPLFGDCDSTHCSFREAVSTPGPRIVVFDVSGTITLSKMVKISEPYLTVACQSAPGDGITFRNDPIQISTHNVIFRYCRMRTGEVGKAEGDIARAMQIYSPAYKPEPEASALASDPNNRVHDVIIDHMSFSWGLDTTFEFWNQKDPRPKDQWVSNVTVQWSIVSEPLYCNKLRPHSENVPDESSAGFKCHGLATLLGSNNENISMHHNLFSQAHYRNPVFSGESGEIVNNLVMHGTQKTSQMTGDHITADTRYRNTPMLLSVINNKGLLFSGNSVPDTTMLLWINNDPDAFAHQFFVSGNINECNGSATDCQHFRTSPDEDDWLSISENYSESGVVDEQNRALQPHVFGGIPLSIDDTSQLEDTVLSSAGASAVRDEVDLRVIADIQSRKRRILDTQSFDVTHSARYGLVPDITQYVLSRNDYCSYTIPCTGQDIADDGYPILNNRPDSDPLRHPASFDADRDGMADAWETEQSVSDPFGYDMNNGYTNVENFLNTLVSLPGNYTAEPETGGGGNDQASHQSSDLSWLFGFLDPDDTSFFLFLLFLFLFLRTFRILM